MDTNSEGVMCMRVKLVGRFFHTIRFIYTSAMKKGTLIATMKYRMNPSTFNCYFGME